MTFWKSKYDKTVEKMLEEKVAVLAGAEVSALKEALVEAEDKVIQLRREKNTIQYGNLQRKTRLDNQEAEIARLKKLIATTYDDYEAATRESRTLAEAVNQLSRKVTFHKGRAVKWGGECSEMREVIKGKDERFEELKKHMHMWKGRAKRVLYDLTDCRNRFKYVVYGKKPAHSLEHVAGEPNRFRLGISIEEGLRSMLDEMQHRQKIQVATIKRQRENNASLIKRLEDAEQKHLRTEDARKQAISVANGMSRDYADKSALHQNAQSTINKITASQRELRSLLCHASERADTWKQKAKKLEEHAFLWKKRAGCLAVSRDFWKNSCQKGRVSARIQLRRLQEANKRRDIWKRKHHRVMSTIPFELVLPSITEFQSAGNLMCGTSGKKSDDAKQEPEITYAKVGGPPANWHGLEVVDLDTGEIVRDVIEVDAVNGWLMRIKIPYTIHEEGVMTERVTGNFEIRKGKTDEAS